MKTFEIVFKEPVQFNVETKEEAIVKFAEMLDKYLDLNQFFTATEKHKNSERD